MMDLSYLRGRLSKALTEAIQPEQEVLCMASFVRCCFSTTTSVSGGGGQAAVAAAQHDSTALSLAHRAT